MTLAATQALLQSIRLDNIPPRPIGRLVAHEAMALEIEDFHAPLLTPIRIARSDGTSVSGEIVGFRGHRSLALPLQTNVPLAVGARIVADGQAGLARCGQPLLGRVVDAMGQPLDGLPLPLLSDAQSLAGSATNPLDRSRVTQPFDCGVRAINALLSLGEGQRVALIAGSGVGKSVLLGQMLSGSDCDVVVAGLIGERAREVSDFVEARLTGEMRRRTVVVATTADEAPLLRLKAAMRATAIAEYFRALGKRVLLLVDSLIILSRSLAEAGVYPAIDIGRSLSRTMADTVDAEHRLAAQRFRQLWSTYEENRDLILMGAYAPGSDPLLDEAVARQSEMRSFIAQREDALVLYSDSRAALIEGFGT